MVKQILVVVEVVHEEMVLLTELVHQEVQV
jgi:hypothetical protein